MIKQKYRDFRDWLSANTHIHLREITTKIGAVITVIAGAIAAVAPAYAAFDQRIAQLGAVCGVALILIKPKATPDA